MWASLSHPGRKSQKKRGGPDKRLVRLVSVVLLSHGVIAVILYLNNI